MSKKRSDVISFPKNSTRSGSGVPNEKTSSRPPRTANCPTSSTIGTRSNPRSVRSSISVWNPASSPTRSVRRSPASASGIGARSCNARRVVTSSRVRPPRSASTASTRSAPISRWGSLDSYGRASRWGNKKDVPSPRKSSRSTSISIARLGEGATTTRRRFGLCSCRAATVADAAEPIAPDSVRCSPRPGSARQSW